MDCKKYIGMDVHQATISIAVMDEAGKVVMDSVIETKARTILEFIQGLRGTLWVTFEEGTSAALVIRPVENVCRQGGSLRSPQERTTQSGQQE